MKKVVFILVFVLAIISIAFAGYEAFDYYTKKSKIEKDKTLINIEDKIHEVDLKIQDELKKEEEIKLEKKDKIEELELWRQKKKEIIESM